MGDPLRDRRAVADLAAKRQVIEFSAETGDFERLNSVIEADLAQLPAAERPAGRHRQPVTGRLEFGENGAGAALAALEGRVEARVTSVCQRCLEAFDWPLEIGLKLDFVLPGSAAKVREGFEVWELGSSEIRPIEIVDEALVMAMPLAPKHEDSARCVELESPAEGEDKVRPFAGLRARMDDDKRN